MTFLSHIVVSSHIVVRDIFIGVSISRTTINHHPTRNVRANRKLHPGNQLVDSKGRDRSVSEGSSLTEIKKWLLVTSLNVILLGWSIFRSLADPPDSTLLLTTQ